MILVDENNKVYISQGIKDHFSSDSDFTVIKKEWPKDNFPFTTNSAPIEIKAKGQAIPSWKIDNNYLCGVLPPNPVQSHEPVEEITLIPMGAARLRISAFPVIQ